VRYSSLVAPYRKSIMRNQIPLSKKSILCYTEIVGPLKLGGSMFNKQLLEKIINEA
jgi:hypothetical protein